MTTLEIALSVTLGSLIVAFTLLVRWINRVHKAQLTALDSQKRSLSTVYGKTTEQFAPFMERYPFDSQDFRFIGTPVDGLQFEDDKVVFVEIKAGRSAGLSPKQERIKRLIQERRVEWFEFPVR
jgi:predicted Holliday junction resolvase-like endonuclease